MPVMAAEFGVWQGERLAFGLTVIAQGFETSRQLDDVYDAQTRIRSMIIAQALFAAMYRGKILFLGLTPLPRPKVASETAIIEVMAHRACALALLLVAAALAARFRRRLRQRAAKAG